MHRLHKIVEVILLCVVAIAPLPLGSNRNWAWAPLASLIGATLLLQALVQTGSRSTHRMPLNGLIIPISVIGAIAICALAQTASLDLIGQTHSLFSTASEALGQASLNRIAIDIERSLTGLMRLLMYCGVFLLSAQLSQDIRYARQLMAWLVASAVIVTFYGFAMHVDNRSCVVINIIKAPIGSSCAFSGTFINSSNYATFAGLAALVCIVEIYGRFLNIDLSGAGARKRLRAQLSALSGTGGIVIGALTVLVGGLVLSASRAGAGSFLCACIVTIMVLNGAKRRRSRTRTLAFAMIVLFTLAIFALTGEMLMSRLFALVRVGDPGRTALYSMSLDAIALHPWVGWGIGSFESVFTILQPLTLEIFYDKAHNAYLESAVEIGIPATVLLLLAIALPAFRCLRGVFVRNRDPHYPALGFGAAILVALHSLVDFSIQIPAVALTFAALLGLGWAQSWSSRLQSS